MRALPSLALLLSLACRPGGGSDVGTGSDGGTVDSGDGGEGSAADHILGQAALAGFDVEILGSPPDFRCDGDETEAEHCNEEYRQLAAANFAGGDLPRCVDELVGDLLLLRAELDANGTDPVTAISNAGLAVAVVEGLRLDALAPGGEVGLAVGPVVELSDHRQLELVFTDPLTGDFPGRLLLPPQAMVEVDGPPPAILFLPGHFPVGGGQLDDAADLRHGRRLAALGYAVLIIAYRAYDAGVLEFEAVTELLCSDLSLGLLRQREALLGLDLIAALRATDVVGQPLGLMGHSGGGTWATLLGTHADVDVVVFDNGSQQYVAVGEPDNKGNVQILDDTMPELVPLFDCVYDLDIPSSVPASGCDREAPTTPHLWVQYGYEEVDFPAVLEVLDAALR